MLLGPPDEPFFYVQRPVWHSAEACVAPREEHKGRVARHRPQPFAPQNHNFSQGDGAECPLRPLRPPFGRG